MTNNYSFAEKKRIRKSFEKISSVMSLPDILEIQTDSYKHFLQEEAVSYTHLRAHETPEHRVRSDEV